MDRISRRQRRIEDEPKLNMSKVIGTIIAIAVIIMLIVSIIKLINKPKTNTEIVVKTAYFASLVDDKYGVIDNTGKTIIKNQYDEMIIIPDKEKDLFICSISDFENDTYSTKVLNSENKEILTNYENVNAIENYVDNELIYENDVLTYQKDGMLGLLDFKGNQLLSAEYESIEALEGIEKSLLVKKDGMYGIYNDGLNSLIIDCKYSSISSLVENNADYGYIVYDGSKYGVVSGTGKTVLNCDYNEIKKVYGNNMYVVKDDSNLKVIDNALNVIIDGGYDDFISIDLDKIIVKKDNLYGVIDTSNVQLIPIEYESLKAAADTYYIAKKDGLYGVISSSNDVCLEFKYKSLAYISKANFYQGENEDYTSDLYDKKFNLKLSNVIISELNIDKAYMRVRKSGEYKYYNFNFESKENKDILTTATLYLSKKDGKYGYKNSNGDLVVDYIYDDAKEQNSYGYCAVKKDGVWGVLNKDGTVILKPSVNLDENLVVDFISDYALYKETNLNLYVK